MRIRNQKERTKNVEQIRPYAHQNFSDIPLYHIIDSFLGHGLRFLCRPTIPEVREI